MSLKRIDFFGVWELWNVILKFRKNEKKGFCVDLARSLFSHDTLLLSKTWGSHMTNWNFFLCSGNHVLF